MNIIQAKGKNLPKCHSKEKLAIDRSSQISLPPNISCVLKNNYLQKSKNDCENIAISVAMTSQKTLKTPHDFIFLNL